jgi:hypothetical protein
MILNCYVCKRDFTAAHFNVGRITISCPVCETNLNIAQSAGRVYGDLVGKQISGISEKLERVLSKSRSGDQTDIINLSQRRIEKLCEEGSCTFVSEGAR